MTKVVAIGECMAELSSSGQADTYRLGFAGDTFNTAWYLKSAAPEIDVSYYTVVGDDDISAQMLRFMDSHGIETSQVRRQPGHTVGLYLISLEDGERSFSYWRGQSAARALADDSEALRYALDDADIVYFSGITLAILSPAARGRLLSGLSDARAAGTMVVFDPNLRPRLWDDARTMTSTIMDATQVSDIALPSFDDEARYFGDRDPLETAQRYQGAGVTTVVVKDGPNPVIFTSETESGTVPVPTITEVVDTTAAGDSFNAGFLADLIRGHALEEAISSGASIASKVICGSGALVDLRTQITGWKTAY